MWKYNLIPCDTYIVYDNGLNIRITGRDSDYVRTLVDTNNKYIMMVYAGVYIDDRLVGIGYTRCIEKFDTYPNMVRSYLSISSPNGLLSNVPGGTVDNVKYILDLHYPEAIGENNDIHGPNVRVVRLDSSYPVGNIIATMY